MAAAAEAHCLVSETLVGVGHRDSSLPENLESEGAEPPTRSRCDAFRDAPAEGDEDAAPSAGILTSWGDACDDRFRSPRRLGLGLRISTPCWRHWSASRNSGTAGTDVIARLCSRSAPLRHRSQRTSVAVRPAFRWAKG